MSVFEPLLTKETWIVAVPITLLVRVKLPGFAIVSRTTLSSVVAVESESLPGDVDCAIAISEAMEGCKEIPGTAVDSLVIELWSSVERLCMVIG